MGTPDQENTTTTLITFYACKYGGGYFVTEDHRILVKRRELDAVIGPSLAIVTLEEFFSVYH